MVLNFLNLFTGKKAEKSAREEIFLQNTLTGKKEVFVPIRPGKVGMYHCGPTVYSFQHIGNYRSYVFADTLKRLFLYKKFDVKQVINITDVGHLTDDADQGADKIEEGAKKEHKSVSSIVKLYTDDFLKNLESLNINTDGTKFPKASEHITEQIVFIQTLEEKGYVYKTGDGIYFDTSLFKDYGKLGKIDIKNLREGARVAANSEKKNPTDFALWKFSKPEEKRQQEWDSPWGKGFPGWHIECSAMGAKYLGHQFDIHTGGIDHIPTHHQNEIAQSECAFGKIPANYWMHNEHVRVDGKKISKSLGNTILIKNITDKKIPATAFRYWLLSSHYRTPVNFTWQALEAAGTALFRLKKAFFENEEKIGKPVGNYLQTFLEAWSDDLDTPKAIATVWEILKDSGINTGDKKATLLELDKLLGLGLKNAGEGDKLAIEKPLKSSELPQEVVRLVKEREEARKTENWQKADEIRGKITSLGYKLKDGPGGTELLR